jgi:hypothetical protein
MIPRFAQDELAQEILEVERACRSAHCGVSGRLGGGGEQSPLKWVFLASVCSRLL